MRLQEDLVLIDLSETAKKFGLGEPVLEGFVEERSGVVPNTRWKKKKYW